MKILLDAHVPLERRDLLVHPIGERMRPGGGDLQAAPRREFDDRSAQPHQFRTKVRRTATDPTPHLDHRLMQLRLDLLEHEMVAIQNLRYVGTELASLGIDDRILFFDAKGKRWGLREGAGLGYRILRERIPRGGRVPL